MISLFLTEKDLKRIENGHRTIMPMFHEGYLIIKMYLLVQNQRSAVPAKSHPKHIILNSIGLHIIFANLLLFNVAFQMGRHKTKNY